MNGTVGTPKTSPYHNTKRLMPDEERNKTLSTMASKVTGGSPNDKAKRKTYGSGDRPLNNYNLFYHLECTLYHQKVCKQTPQNTFTSKLPNFKYYADLPDQFPPTPARYQGLILAEDWFMGGKKRVKKKVPGQMKMALTCQE